MRREVLVGARYSELWLKARDDSGLARLQEDYEIPRAGVWVSTGKQEFDAELLTPDRWGRLAPAELEPWADTVYLAMYDGPAGELCGAFLYEHRAGSALRRALVYAPDAEQTLRWGRVEGEAEAWEAAVIAVHLDRALERWLDAYRWADPPAPLPPAEEIARARARWSSFREGEAHPYVSEYALCRAVLDAVLQPRA